VVSNVALLVVQTILQSIGSCAQFAGETTQAALGPQNAALEQHSIAVSMSQYAQLAHQLLHACGG